MTESWARQSLLDPALHATGWTEELIRREETPGAVIALPPVDEQRRIAARLSEQLAEIDRAKAALNAQREAVDALPAALLREAFGPATSLDV